MNVSTRVGHGSCNGTVIGLDKARQPIVREDADGLCLIDTEASWTALLTPKEISAIKKESTVNAYRTYRSQVVGTIVNCWEACGWMFRNLRGNLSVTNFVAEADLARYRGIPLAG